MGAKQSKVIRSPFSRLCRLGRKSRVVPMRSFDTTDNLASAPRFVSRNADDLVLEDVDIEAEFGTVFQPSVVPQLGIRASPYTTKSQRYSNLQSKKGNDKELDWIITENMKYPNLTLLDIESYDDDTGEEDYVSDSDTLTHVTWETMSYDSDLLSILGQEADCQSDGLHPPHQLSPIHAQFNTDKKNTVLDMDSLDLSDLMIMFTASEEQESVATEAAKKQPDYVLFMSLPTAEDLHY